MEYFCTKCGAPCDVSTPTIGFSFAFKSKCCDAPVSPQIAIRGESVSVPISAHSELYKAITAEVQTMEQSLTEGRKDDNDKIRMDLLPFEALEAVAKVLTFGAKKYTDNGWKTLENAGSEKLGALLRHLSKHLRGIELDEESGLSHISHMAANALMLVYFEEKKNVLKK
jgi:hypothetical protein